MDAASILRSVRQEARLSQRALAERSGVPQPAIARIESGAVSPRVDTLDRLLAHCGRSVVPGPRTPKLDPQDLRQIQDNLRRSPAQRLRNLETAVRSIRTLQRGRRRK